MIDLVCSVCGSNEWTDVQHSVDKRWPLARCKGHHRDRGQIWFPLISTRAYQARRKALPATEPIDLFGALSPSEQAQLAQDVKLR